MILFAWVAGLLVAGGGSAAIAYRIGFERGGAAWREHQEQVRLDRIARGRPHPAREGSQPAKIRELRVIR